MKKGVDLDNFKGITRDLFERLIQEDTEVRTGLHKLKSEDVDSSMVAYYNGLIMGKVGRVLAEASVDVPVKTLMTIVNELITEKGGKTHEYTGDKI